MGNSRLQEITAFIKAGQKDQARELLRAEIKDSPSADAWFWAAHVAVSENQQVEFLEKSLELDPFHRESYEMLEELRGEKISTEQFDPKPRKAPVDIESAIEAELLEKSMAMFGKFGWNLTLSTDKTKKFEKNLRISGRSTWLVAFVVALFVYLFLSDILVAIIVFGIFAVAANVALLAQRDYVTLQSTGKGYLLVSSSANSETRRVQSASQIDDMARNAVSARVIGCAEPVIVIAFFVIFVAMLVLAGLTMFS